jgi:predicted transcriptional regulator
MTTSEQVVGALNEAINSKNLHLDEVAQVVGVSERQAYRYTEGEVALKANQFIALALIEYSRGGQNLLSLILPTSTVLTAAASSAVDGRIEEEAIEAVQALGTTTDKFTAGKFDEAIESADNLINAGKRLKLEAQEAKKKGKRR